MAPVLEREQDRVQGRAFEWGVDDCVLYASNRSFQITGFDPFQGARARHGSKFGALRLLVALGGDLRKATERQCLSVGMKPIEPSLAPPGSIGLLPMPDGDAAVCVANHSGGFEVRTDHGIAIYPADDIEKAWRCPHQP